MIINAINNSHYQRLNLHHETHGNAENREVWTVCSANSERSWCLFTVNPTKGLCSSGEFGCDMIFLMCFNSIYCQLVFLSNILLSSI